MTKRIKIKRITAKSSDLNRRFEQVREVRHAWLKVADSSIPLDVAG
jgi:hypothetical protein